MVRGSRDEEFIEERGPQRAVEVRVSLSCAGGQTSDDEV